MLNRIIVCAEMRSLGHTLTNGAEWLLPRSCLLCDTGLRLRTKAPAGLHCSLRSLLCRCCWREITKLPILGEVAFFSPYTSCTDSFAAKPLKAFALWSYNPLIQSLLHAAKFKPSAKLLKALGQHLKSVIPNQGFSSICSVPPSESKSRQRLINPTSIIANELAAGVQHLDMFGRHTNSLPQTDLDRKHRLKNARKSFFVKEQFRSRIAGEHFLLVDDVSSTGASVTAVSEILFAHGARDVSIALLAYNKKHKYS